MRQKGIDPRSVHGSGPNGRIVEADVLDAATSGGAGGSDSTFCLKASANVATLVSLQGQVAEQVQRLCGTPLGLGDLVLRAMALALAGQPEAQRALGGDLDNIHVGLELPAVQGRAVATIAEANRLGLLDLVRRRAAATAAADATAPATLALLDLSDTAVDECLPMVRAPFRAVLGLGRCKPRSVVLDEQLVLRPTVCLALAADARVLAPQTAAELLGEIVALPERPFVLVCDRPPW